MKKIILVLISICCLEAAAQEMQRNSLSTSLIRLEKNSQTVSRDYQLKFITGLEYQRLVNKWGFGVKYEHGFNKIEESPKNCADCLSGTGYLREDNVYLTANYAIVDFLDSRLKFHTGVGLYYSNLHFSGEYQGGFDGGGATKNSTYNTLGLSPTASIIYYPTDRLFISLHSTMRYGWSQEFDEISTQDRKTHEFVITAPELKIGVNF